MAKAPSPIEETIQNLSIDEHDYSFSDEDESGTAEEQHLIRKDRGAPRSKTLDSIVSNLNDDCGTMQEHMSALEKSQLNAKLRDSSLGLILKQNHSKAFLLLESMTPLPGDRLYVLFLMAECELHLTQSRERKCLLEFTNELLQSESVDCENLLELGNNLSFPMNRLVGWIHLYDVARKIMAIKYSNQDKYAAWIVSPAHEIGLNAYNGLKFVVPSDVILSLEIRSMMKEWVTSLRYVSNEKLKDISEIQCRVSSDLIYSIVLKVVGGGRIDDHYRNLRSKYYDLSLHKVHSFLLMAMAMYRIFGGRSVQDIKAGIKHCNEGFNACACALDFTSPAEKHATMLTFIRLLEIATELIRQ